MIIPLLPLAKLLFSGGGDSADSSGKVKIPAKILFDGQPLRTGPDNGFNTLGHCKKSDDASVLGRTEDGMWCFLWSDSGDGWVHVTTILVDGDADSLPVWPNPINGYIYHPDATVTRETDLKNGSDAAYETLVCIPGDTEVKIMAIGPKGHWLFIWSEQGDGWVPKSAVSTRAPLGYLPTWTQPIKGAMFRPKGNVTPAHLNVHAGPAWTHDKVAMLTKGAEVNIRARNEGSDWLYIVSAEATGWVPANQISSAGDMSKLSVWSGQA